MRVVNLTPHQIQVYRPGDFIGLEQSNPTTWVADSVGGAAIATYASEGCARISVSTQAVESDLPGETVATQYGEATGIPSDLDGTEILIVSLPMQSMAKQAGLPQAGQMVAPYKVVRSKSNGSVVLGCMGFTY